MHKVDQKVIAIVDAFSTASNLPSLLKKNGCRLIHIQSSDVIPEIYQKSYHPENFEENFIYNNDDLIIAKLRELSVTDIIAGAECGILVADKLAKNLELSGNSPLTSVLRRNKYLMGEAIRQHGLNAVTQAEISSVGDATAIAKYWSKWPVVVKPLNSAGSDGVHICHTEEQLAYSCGLLLEKKNRLDITNTKILLQERMYGQQYIVNTISISGQHFITEIWRDNRIEVDGAGLIYDHEILIDRSATEWSSLETYSLEVLMALDVSFGPCHIEIMMTQSGPKLIELGARLQGGISSKAVCEAIGESHLTLTAQLLVDREKLEKYISKPYRIKKNIMAVAFVVRDGGEIIQSHLQETVAKLPSFYLFMSKPEKGDIISKTTDLFTSPGVVYLVSDDINELNQDYQQIREWEEKSMLFELDH